MSSAPFLFVSPWAIYVRVRLSKFSKSTFALALLGLLAIACVLVWVAVYAASQKNILTIAVLDVGQGDSLFIESPTGVQVLIDGGPDSSVLRELSSVMPSFDRSLDAVIATHPDADHIGGLVDVVRRYEVGAFIEPGIPKPTETAEALQREVKKKEISHYIARRGMVLDLGGGVALSVLLPAGNVSTLPSDHVNEGGIVLRLVYKNSEALLMADVPKFVEVQLVALSKDELESDILKVGHHGSRTSTSNALLEVAKPSIAIISSGKNNRYGHPHQETLAILARFSVPVLRTDKEGTIIFESNGETFLRK